VEISLQPPHLRRENCKKIIGGETEAGGGFGSGAVEVLDGLRRIQLVISTTLVVTIFPR
jgi:hypothetical protein